MQTSRGFSLLELLIVVALVVTLSVIGSGMYRNFGKNVELSSTEQTIAADLRQMQAKAMAGEGGYRWGGHFVKGTPDDYYVLFSTSGTTFADASTASVATTTLSKGITFSDPASGFKDIVFNKISGTTTAATVSVTSEGLMQTVNVTSVGTIY